MIEPDRPMRAQRGGRWCPAQLGHFLSLQLSLPLYGAFAPDVSSLCAYWEGNYSPAAVAASIRGWSKPDEPQQLEDEQTISHTSDCRLEAKSLPSLPNQGGEDKAHPLTATAEPDFDLKEEGRGPDTLPTDGRNQDIRLFDNAQNVNAGDVSLTVVKGDYVRHAEHSDKGWDTLKRFTSPNAVHTSDAVSRLLKCDPGTRVEALSRINDWAWGTQQSILCMTGAAGSGKTAIALTSAEQFTRNEGALVATFIFSSSDDTRNSYSKFISTIAYQLGLRDARLRKAISAAVENDEQIFAASLEIQASKLVVEPFMGCQIQRLPVVFLDGIDQCQGEEDQERLLSLLADTSLWGGTPFRFFVTGRPELAIHSALQSGGILDGSYCIRLSQEKEYNATEDIRRTLQLHLPRLVKRAIAELEADINILVAAASGQYIYAATVIQYISKGRRDSPFARLKVIVDWIVSPREDLGPPIPLQPLYDLYAMILSSAARTFTQDSIGTRKDSDPPFPLLLRAFAYVQSSTAPWGTSEPGSIHDSLLGLNEGTFNSVICDVRSLAAPREPKETGPLLQFYNRTCLDFLQDEARSGKELYVEKATLEAFVFERLYGVFTQSVEYVTSTVAANKDGQWAYDEKVWTSCTSVMLLGELLQTGLGPQDLKRFADANGWEKLKEWVNIARDYPQFYENELTSAAVERLWTLQESEPGAQMPSIASDTTCINLSFEWAPKADVLQLSLARFTPTGREITLPQQAQQILLYSMLVLPATVGSERTGDAAVWRDVRPEYMAGSGSWLTGEAIMGCRLSICCGSESDELLHERAITPSHTHERGWETKPLPPPPPDIRHPQLNVITLDLKSAGSISSPSQVSSRPSTTKTPESAIGTIGRADGSGGCPNPATRLVEVPLSGLVSNERASGRVLRPRQDHHQHSSSSPRAGSPLSAIPWEVAATSPGDVPNRQDTTWRQRLAHEKEAEGKPESRHKAEGVREEAQANRKGKGDEQSESGILEEEEAQSWLKGEGKDEKWDRMKKNNWLDYERHQVHSVTAAAEPELERKEEERSPNTSYADGADLSYASEDNAMQCLAETAKTTSPTTKATTGSPSHSGSGNAAEAHPNVDAFRSSSMGTQQPPPLLVRDVPQTSNRDPAIPAYNENDEGRALGIPFPTPANGSNSATVPNQVTGILNVTAQNFTAGVLNAMNAGRDVKLHPEKRSRGKNSTRLSLVFSCLSDGESDLLDSGWKVLKRRTSPNAIHTSGAVSRLSKCDPGTRVEVLRKIDYWARRTQQHLLCMTGAAGSGKTAIALTSADRFNRSDPERILAATYIFSCADNTRNNYTALIPTIAYQLGLLDERLRGAIAKAVEHDENVVHASLEIQATKLIAEPLRVAGEEQQDYLLSLLANTSLWAGTPFRFLITGRPELAIYSALQPGGHLDSSDCIRLSDDEAYDATNDIRRSLILHLPGLVKQTGDELEEDVNIITEAASGQYIYPATVIKYVSGGRRDSPLSRLKIVVQWIFSPGPARDLPSYLKHLYCLYKNILSYAAEMYKQDSIGSKEAPFVLLLRAFASIHTPAAPGGSLETGPIHDGLLKLNTGTFNSVLCDVRSLAVARKPEETGPVLHFYHRTCLDFLRDKDRAGKDLYIEQSRVETYILKRCYATFIPSVEIVGTMVAAGGSGVLSDDEEFWRSCTSASLLGGILQCQISGREIKRFAKEKGWEKLKEWVSLAKEYPKFAEDELVKMTLMRLRTLRESQNTEIAAQARDIFEAIDVRDG
ncbi:hypothetical protein NMY22_g8485 [Coprinellus aureogranulatus]|nr:hypothetical protein NMY22_g8485 [Coprinellus aureogranulatus]